MPQPTVPEFSPLTALSSDPPTVPNSSHPAAQPLPTIPGYRLERELGRGAMGVVFLAEHEQLQRRVAVKMILAGDFASSRERERFAREATAIAHLHHPGIVQIHDIGHHEDRPYFALEFVPGGSLADYLALHSLTPLQAAAVVESVADAIQHAHDHDIIHRDLKPANILLTPRPTANATELPFQVKITDFGMAKFGESGQTASHAHMGTPEYMSPEQAAGLAKLVGPTADVYALGGILYKCLTGRVPFVGETSRAVVRQVLDEEPIPVRRLEPRCPRDLETICLKCLEKAPPRRYASARALAEDLRRFARNEPVIARSAGPLERAGKWVRRHALISALVSTVFTLLVGGVIGLAVLLQRAWTAESAAALHAQAANESAERAGAERRLTRQALDTLTSEYLQDRWESQPELTARDRAYLNRVLEFYQEFARQGGTTATAQADQARGLSVVANIQDRLGAHKSAVENSQSAMRMWIELIEQHPDNHDFQYQLASAQHYLSQYLQHIGQDAAALEQETAALRLRTALTAAVPDRDDYHDALANTHTSLGTLANKRGARATAHEHYQTALELKTALTKQHPKVTRYRQELAALHHHLARSFSELGDTAAAQKHGQAAFRLRKELFDQAPTVANYRCDLAGSHTNLATWLANTGDRIGARREYEAALQLYAALVKEFPAVPLYRQRLASAHNNLSGFLSADGEHITARTHQESALKLQQVLVEQYPEVPSYQQELAASHTHMAAYAKDRGEFVAAENHHETAQRLRQTLVAQHPQVPAYRRELGSGHNNRGTSLAAQQRWPEARQRYEQAVHILQPLVAEYPDVPAYRADLARAHSNLASVLRNLGNIAGTQTHYDTAIQLLTQCVEQTPTLPQMRQELANTYIGLGSYMSARNVFPGARKAYDTAQLHLERLAREYPHMRAYRNELALTHARTGHVEAATGATATARKHYDQAVALLEVIYNETPTDQRLRQTMFEAYWGRAEALDQLGESAKAVTDWQRVLEFTPPSEKVRMRLRGARSQIRAGQTATALTTTRGLLPTLTHPWDCYDVARTFALAAEQTPADRETLAAEAVLALRSAYAAGWKDVGHTEKFLDFASLRERADFRALLHEARHTERLPRAPRLEP